MKKTLIFLILVITTFELFGQSQGISYQAVLINENDQEIPGIDIQGNYLPNQELTVRFTISGESETIDYQEEHETSTDKYGMINLIIGEGNSTSESPGNFMDIDWNGTPKDLKVEISLGESENNFEEFGFEKLNFVPYAYHRNITASGTMIIEGVTDLNNELNVEGVTNLNNELNVEGLTNLNNQVTINADVSGNQGNQDSYPLRVQGSNQGIAIIINDSRDNGNNFITFWDTDGVQGRIEGQTTGELWTDPEYIFDNSVLVAQEGLAIANVAAASSSTTACAGVGACVTAPVASLIIAAAAALIVQTAQIAGYNTFKNVNIGITYQSGSGDYAEWLPKINLNEKFYAGDIIGIKGGHISKSTENAEYIMVVSKNPIVLGNTPDKKNESNYEKIAFMGQVPVKVLGNVNIGDYILPSGRNDGFGIAVNPNNMRINDYKKIVGIAWSESETEGFNIIKVAVGLNANDIGEVVVKQEIKIKKMESEIQYLKNQMSKINNVLAKLVPDYKPETDSCDCPVEINSTKKESIVVNTGNEDFSKVESGPILHYSITREHLLEGFILAEKIMQKKGVDTKKHKFFVKVNNDPAYKEKIIVGLLDALERQKERNTIIDKKAENKKY